MMRNGMDTDGVIGVFFWPALCFLCLLHLVPFYSEIGGTWFYPLIWWTFILVLELGLYRRGQAIFLTGGASFLRVACFSAVLWFVFEVYNLYLGNWYYVGVPNSRLLRWFGTTISFATVLPGMWVVQRHIVGVLPDSLSQRASLVVTGKLTHGVLTVGLVFSIGPFLVPDRMFPFVWGGLLLVADGVAYRSSERSFLGQFSVGNYKPCISWVLAGLACGLLWEFWNYLAAAGWIYTVPYMGRWRLFEMPVIGYLGFAPFAMMSWRIFTLWNDMIRGNDRASHFLAGIVSLLFVLFTLMAMDHYTFASTRAEPLDFEGWSREERSILMSNHVRSLSNASEVLGTESARRKIDMLNFASLGTEIGNCLWTSGIHSVNQIQRESTDKLARILHNCRGGPLRFWTRRVKDWKQRRD